MRKNIVNRLALVVVAIAAGLIAYLLLNGDSGADGKSGGSAASVAGDRPVRPNRAKGGTSASAAKRSMPENAELQDAPIEAANSPQDEISEDEAERRVETFDAFTDKWMEPSTNGVPMADVRRFCDLFRKLPPSRRDECLQRAMNLVPDENVMLLAGILMDKSHGADVLNTVYSDMLNRSEIVKKPILEQIFKDKTHPCWADTAWILDVTDELPKRDKGAAAQTN